MPILVGVNGAAHAFHHDRFINNTAVLMAPEANRETVHVSQGFNAAITGAARRGFHNGDGANILAALARLMDEKIHMRLEKPAGSKLENSSGHGRPAEL